MKTIEVFTALLPSETRPGKFYRSRWKMTREEAARRGGKVDEPSKELRQVFEPGDKVPMGAGGGFYIKE